MIDKLSGFLDKLKPQYDDGAIDRLNYIWTVMILMAFAITIGAKQYVGEPLQCWVPAQFKPGWEQYVENYCFVENTYWVPVDQRVPTGLKERQDREINYYQWVPFVLALQGLLFYIPRLIWKMLCGTSGMNVTALVQSAFITKKEGDKKILKGDTSEGVRIIAAHIRDVVDYHRDYGASRTGPRIPIVSFLSKGMGMYLTVLYILVKALWIVNVVGQFLILNKFLGTQYSWWGIGILTDLINGTEWETSGHFPRVTFCDFVVRRLANQQRFTVQCVLMINMFNEKIFLFVWWWLLIMAILTCLDCIYWLITSMISSFRKEFVRRYLRVKGKLDNHYNNYGRLEDFVRKVLRPDGVLILRLISANAGDIVCADVVGMLWDGAYPPLPNSPLSMDETTPPSTESKVQ